MHIIVCRATMLLFVAAALVLAGCASQQKKPDNTGNKEMTTPTEKAPTRTAAAPTGTGNTRVLYVPTGERTTSAVMLEKTGPYEVILGQAFTYTITATNLTSEKLEGVVISDNLPAGLQIQKSEPAASGSTGRVSWNVGSMPANGQSRVTVTAVANAPGSHVYCAEVTYNQQACITVQVVEPALKLDQTMTPTAMAGCEDINVNLVVTNTGSGMARNVTVSSALSNGLVASGPTSFSAGDLASGQSKTFAVKARASASGEYTSNAVARADNGLEAADADKTMVSKPALAIKKTGDAKVRAGGRVTYTIEVKSVGDGDAKDTKLVDTLPTGATFVSADNGGTAAGGTVTWNLGNMKPGDMRTVSCTIQAPNAAKIRNTAQASAVCADAVAATWDTDIFGIPGVLLEVVDDQDPILVGNTVLYTIRVTNQGNIPQTNINVVCELEDQMAYVSATGTTAATASGKTITFGSVGTLAPKATAEWRVTIKATGEGDVRFKVTSKSDQQGRSVEETESTNFYQ
jgi:uncharacterized repeat protein (TIGR01451 family)